MKKITRFAFAREVVLAWEGGARLSLAIVRAAECAVDEVLSGDDWNSLYGEMEALYPHAFNRYTVRSQLASGFIATHFREASEALWDGKPNKARNSIARSSGKKCGTGMMSSADRVELSRDKRDDSRSITIRARSLSKWHDWATVK